MREAWAAYRRLLECVEEALGRPLGVWERMKLAWALGRRIGMRRRGLQGGERG